MLFNDKGFLAIDELVMNRPSFKKIMDDDIVTEEEIASQSETVLSSLHKIEAHYTPEQQEEITTLLAEASVLFAITHFHDLQSLNR